MGRIVVGKVVSCYLSQFCYNACIMGTLFIVATPIGNLGDITLRALETLKSVDIILCEDTRVTKNLLVHFEITTSTMSYHQHSDSGTTKKIQALLAEGKNLALVTDAGTPGISDPGNLLIAELLKANPTQIISPIPGASAVIAALSISGLPTDKYIFMGFPPHKNKRLKFFQEVAESKYTVAFYESSHRILKAMENLTTVLDTERSICVCREITKKFETIYRGSVGGIAEMQLSEKGEFVVIVAGK